MALDHLSFLSGAVRHAAADLHCFRTALPVHERTLAYNGWLCTSDGHGAMCTDRLCRDRMVCTVRTIYDGNDTDLYFRLISASIGTVVHYGYQCNPMACKFFLSLCFIMGLSGSILPFTDWFNKYEYRVRTHYPPRNHLGLLYWRQRYRIAFFVALALTSIAPLAHLAKLHSAMQMFSFMRMSLSFLNT